ncbi:hypothetical protein KPATCC21470_4398 [Kitasatospora purpeofusca]
MTHGRFLRFVASGRPPRSGAPYPPVGLMMLPSGNLFQAPAGESLVDSAMNVVTSHKPGRPLLVRIDARTGGRAPDSLSVCTAMTRTHTRAIPTSRRGRSRA